MGGREMIDTLDAERIFQSEFLTYQEAAALVRCGHERLRNAPLDQLPRYRVGKEYQVYRPELIRYVLTYCRVKPGAVVDKIIAEVEDVVSSCRDDKPRRSPRRAS
jgi:hypothetical protein